jgi:outer membrane protein assembly factor BamB
LLLASGHLIILSGDGELALVRASPERRVEIARVQALRGKTWNVPALSQGRLLVRNAADMACFDLRPPRMR